MRDLSFTHCALYRFQCWITSVTKVSTEPHGRNLISELKRGGVKGAAYANCPAPILGFAEDHCFCFSIKRTDVNALYGAERAPRGRTLSQCRVWSSRDEAT